MSSEKTQVFLRDLGLILCLTVVLGIIYGFNVDHYHLYNIYSVYDVVNEIPGGLVNSALRGNMPFLYEIFLSYLTPLLQIPVLFLFMSVIAKFLCLVGVFLVARHYGLGRIYSYIFLIVFFFSPSMEIHGPTQNGLFVSLAIHRASISVLLGIFGFYFLLRKYFFWAFLFVFVSVNFHVSYGITALTNFLVLAAINSIVEKDSLFKIIIFSFLILISCLFTIFPSTDYQLLPTTLEFTRYYEIATVLEPDDRTLIWSLQRMSVTLAVLYLMLIVVTVAEFKALITKNWVLIFSVLALTSLNVIYVSFEFLLGEGAVPDIIADGFVGIQVRRQIWVLVLFILLAIFSIVQRYNERKNY